MKKSIDFVTVVYSDEIEIKLLKLQAHSFSFVYPDIINNILVIFNDKKSLNEQMRNKFYDEIIECYPVELIDKVKLLFLEDLNLDFDYSNWFTQQLIKLEISKHVTSDYYVVLDSKNHFIKIITSDYFFKNNTSPYLYFNYHNDKMLEFYSNSLNYFDIKCPYDNNENFDKMFKIQSSTPFLFITKECINMIKYVEARENKPFKDFFVETKQFTEFFFYYTYLIFSNKYLLYEYSINLQPIITVGPQNPVTENYNTWEYKKNILDNNKIYIFSLHRNCFKILDNDYKENLLKFYKNIYKDLNVIKIIENLLI